MIRYTTSARTITPMTRYDTGISSSGFMKKHYLIFFRYIYMLRIPRTKKQNLKMSPDTLSGETAIRTERRKLVTVRTAGAVVQLQLQSEQPEQLLQPVLSRILPELPSKVWRLLLFQEACRISVLWEM